MNIPLILTLARVLAIPVVIVLFFWQHEHARMWATVVFAAAAITDWLDGWLARKLNQTSAFGAFLDPVADKLLVSTSLILLLSNSNSDVLAVLVAVIIGREITISALREWMAELGKRTSVAVSRIGKWKTGFQMTAIGMMIWKTPFFHLPVYEIGYGLLLIAAGLTLWSMWMYLKAAWPLMKHP